MKAARGGSGTVRRLFFTCAWLGLALAAPEARAQGLFGTPIGQGLASLLLPGGGQYLQDNRGDALLHASLWGTSVLAAAHYYQQDDFLTVEERIDDEREIDFYNDSTLKFNVFALAATDIAFYSSYAAYRDARQADDNDGYTTPAPRESFTDLLLAPFRLEYLARPTTFIPLLVVAAQIADIEEGDRDDDFYEVRYAEDVNETEIKLFHTVGLGMGPAVAEEAFFRGFLNNDFSHRFGRWTGLALSSGVFAAGHLNQGNQASALEALAFGAYAGYLQQRNGYAIGEGVAIHFWGNFLAGLAAVEHGGSANLVHLGFRF